MRSFDVLRGFRGLDGSRIFHYFTIFYLEGDNAPKTPKDYPQRKMKLSGSQFVIWWEKIETFNFI